MLQKELSPAQAAGAFALAVLIGVLIWGAARLQGSRGAAAPAPAEMAPVKEQVTGEMFEEAPAPQGKMGDDQARSREALENMKFGMQQAP